MRADTMTAPLILLLSVTVFMSDAVADAAVENQAGSRSKLTENRPDTELLEFIALFEPVDGAWVDPMHLYDAFEAGNKTLENDHE